MDFYPDHQTLREIEREAQRMQARALADMLSALRRRITGAFRFGVLRRAH